MFRKTESGRNVEATTSTIERGKRKGGIHCGK